MFVVDASGSQALNRALADFALAYADAIELALPSGDRAVPLALKAGRATTSMAAGSSSGRARREASRRAPGAVMRSGLSAPSR